MGDQMDRLMGLAKYQVCRMKDMSDRFYLLNDEPECVNVCFWYLPQRFRGKEITKETKIELGKVSKYTHFMLLLRPNWSIFGITVSLWKMFENGKMAVFLVKFLRKFKISLCLE